MKTPQEMAESDDFTWLEGHACFTGDCSHENANDCVQAIKETIADGAKAKTECLWLNMKAFGERAC